MAISTLTLEGATCPMCANAVSNALHSLQGVQHLDVDLADQIATITYDDDETTDASIRETVDRASCATH
ncbi:heavy-metal-associated domain-containing protein [Alicyclobacillus acidoterrestris]|uniref:Heavy-metal-associated domain-containing protein n=1 Tax=Alicyclobacillus acidoterrestris (strain ATCC 49025 / DSM 3922 / CIP 106132 / NCIMB 13137 / GD3B) TaxID=1356854 RepID=T0D0M2_ALIAG|nr:heavy-metal-associated domain-containing protein [Alicyclobacillus acidoterrestris]EPZ45047.1 hypothetical protein N007_09545 [Alicyclobacillus acidoterrestris ATCC 49025]UNO48335.1 heavy-metal-associated domain-containing protein [Alicyclobacillus acidoterrestris]